MHSICLLLCALFIGANSHNHEILLSFNAPRPQVQQPAFQQQQPVFRQQQTVFQPQQQRQQQMFQTQTSNQRFQPQQSQQQLPFFNQPQVSVNSQRNLIQPPKFQPMQSSLQQPQSILTPRPDTRASIIAQIERQLQQKNNRLATNSNQTPPKFVANETAGIGLQRTATGVVPKFCLFKNTIKCVTSFPYRTLDGSCNNLKNLWWGKSEAPYKRLMTAAYSDGIGEPRVSIDGSELPNPRDLSCQLHTDSYEIDQNVTHMFMQWGQLINHDITSLSVTKPEEKDLGICRTCTRSDKCMPMPINRNATCTCTTNMRHDCIEFTRSSAAFGDTACQSPVREHINLQTPYFDASFMYGVDEEELEKLRDRSSGAKGLFLVQPNGLLPKDMTEKPSDCLDFTHEKRCFKAGDERVNQNPGLMSMHTIFVREHNRIANILSGLNPSWEDVTVFQETRKVISAIFQHISYNEYMRILFGEQTARMMGLLPGAFTYDPNVDPRITEEYVASVGRFGHSMVRTMYSRLNNEFKTAGAGSYMLRNNYFRANLLYDECQGGLEAVVRGFLKDPVMKVDRFFSDDLSKHLFETQDSLGRAFHFDLIAINIQRGRDHGIQSYTKAREFCGLSPIRTWEDLRQVMPADIWTVYRSFYRFVDDIDLFTASVAEIKEPNAMIGPTLKCLLGAQFRDLKFGDRFWYETTEQPMGFNPGQLAEIRKVTFSKVLCRNLKDTPKIQPMAMLSPNNPGNELVNCSDLPDIDWSFWQI